MKYILFVFCVIKYTNNIHRKWEILLITPSRRNKEIVNNRNDNRRIIKVLICKYAEKKIFLSGKQSIILLYPTNHSIQNQLRTKKKDGFSPTEAFKVPYIIVNCWPLDK